jgi:hypothetical protein
MAIQWNSWASLGNPQETEIGSPFAQRNQDGRLEVFAIGSGEIFNISQLFPNGGWRDSWRSKGKPSSSISVKSHAVGRNADGRQQIFAIGEDGALWQQWQVTPNDGWSQWETLGTPTADTALMNRFAVGRNQDLRQEVFAVGSDGNIWQIWQTAPNGGWSNWREMGRPPTTPGIRPSDRITVERNADGRQELFVMGGDDAVWHIWQVAPNGGWNDWESLDKPEDRDLSQPLAHKNADGHLEVFAPGNGAFCNRWQEAANSNIWRREGWNKKPKLKEEAPQIGLTWLEAALNLEDRLKVIGFGDDGALWHSWQVDQPPHWSPWHSLANPPAKIRIADRLTIGTNQDGRLEVFVTGNDGAVWHIWQIR